ncbi:MAG: cytochrome c3 family protein [Gemmatimonadales bacterium]
MALLAASACTDTVYRDRAPFTPPPDAASGFLGYFDASSQQTNCGNCHVGHQSDWKQTKHAQAWANLQAVPIADKSSCVGCHTVSENGNSAAGPAGYLKVADAAYQDVQCESCHGPGNEHVQAPDVALAPLASIHVDTTQVGATEALAAGSCAACHQDTHHPFWEDWRQSLHARMGRHNDEPLCLQCHSGQGALEAWGVTAAYKEQHQVNEGITCSVCHDPHNDANPGQLRYPLASTDVNQQLCMKCHNRRSADPARLDAG